MMMMMIARRPLFNASRNARRLKARNVKHCERGEKSKSGARGEFFGDCCRGRNRERV